MQVGIEYEGSETWVTFDGRPERETLTRLKEMGFKMSGKRKAMGIKKHVPESDLDWLHPDQIHVDGVAAEAAQASAETEQLVIEQQVESIDREIEEWQAKTSPGCKTYEYEIGGNLTNVTEKLASLKAKRQRLVEDLTKVNPVVEVAATEDTPAYAIGGFGTVRKEKEPEPVTVERPTPAPISIPAMGVVDLYRDRWYLHIETGNKKRIRQAVKAEDDPTMLRHMLTKVKDRVPETLAVFGTKLIERKLAKL